MADKKLNEVNKVTDMAYVPVIMADGSIGQIAKADLASVVAEQMPSSFTNRMFKRYQDKSFAPSVSGQTQSISLGTGIWLVCIKFSGNNNEHNSTHVFSAGSYSNKITNLSECNYNSNTRVSIVVNQAGTSGFSVTVNYTHLYNYVYIYAYLLA